MNMNVNSATDTAISTTLTPGSDTTASISQAAGSISSSLGEINEEISALAAQMASGEVGAEAYGQTLQLQHKRDLMQKSLEMLSSMLSSIRDTLGAIIRNIR